MVEKVIEKARSEHQPSLDGPMPFTPVEEKQIPREPSYEQEPIERRTSESRRPEKFVPHAFVEEELVSMKQKPNREALDRPASENTRPEEGIVPFALVEGNKKRSVIRHKTGELIVSIKPLTQSISPGMVVAQPYVKSYFRPKRDEILDKVAKPETTATVQVTIGRIEVRATQAAAIPQRKRAEPPVMSLEDYLKIKRGSL
jgi:hypothetical protein